MKTGDILACSSDRLISKLIKSFTKSSYSHVALIVIIQEEQYVIEMQKEGCELISFNNWLKKYNYKYEIYQSPITIPVKKLLNLASVTKYDLRSLLLRQPIKIIKELLFNKSIILNKVKNENSKMTCSEFVAFIHNFQPYYDLTPDDVVNECKKLNYIKL